MTKFRKGACENCGALTHSKKGKIKKNLLNIYIIKNCINFYLKLKTHAGKKINKINAIFSHKI